MQGFALRANKTPVSATPTTKTCRWRPRVARPGAPVFVFTLALLLITSCHAPRVDRSTVVFLIESSPTSLDPRIGTDGQSEHIDALLFDGLVVRDASFRVAPGLAERWEQPDPLTIVFHLRAGVRFSDGRTLAARDVKWTLDSMTSGTIITAKAASYASVVSVDAPDAQTVVMHLKVPDNFLLTNLSTGAMGIVPYGSGRDFWQHPVGSGPFRFVSQEIDKEVVIERNPMSWQRDAASGNIQRVRFAVVPDPITRALELRKGSADLESNSLLPDMFPTLAEEKHLIVESVGGTQVQYLGFNTVDPMLRDARVRQAIACAIDVPLIVRTLQDGRAKATVSLLPQTHWAWTADVARYDYDPARARQLLDEAGYRPDAKGVRLHLTMKTSTDEGTRQLAATLQQELAQVGIDLEIRSYESATFLQDLMRGSFQMYGLRWIGGNEQPDIFGYAFSTARIPPRGANRGRYHNPELDVLLDDAARSTDQAKRKADYVRAQQILARDLPAFNLWYKDSIVVHNRRLSGISISPSGSFEFLSTARVQM